VQDNQANLRQDLEDWFVYGDQQQFQNMNVSYHETVSQASGRVEMRRCWALADPIAMEYIRHYAGWTDLQTLVRVQREIQVKGQTSHETVYYMSSIANDAQRLLANTRHHWAVENSFHGVLDVTFRGDYSHIRCGESSENMAALRSIALNLLKRNTTKNSLKQQRFRAAMDNDFLFQLLTQICCDYPANFCRSVAVALLR
jgi:predicted transposase YbfD/YdcC